MSKKQFKSSHSYKKDNSKHKSKPPLMKISDGLKKQADAEKMNLR